MMKLLVIGHSVLDFTKSDAEQKVSAGGIFYSILALNQLLQNDDVIFLCSQFDDETYNYFKPEFEKINKKYLHQVDKIPRVHLTLQKDSERHEAYENITNSLSVEILNLDFFDGILINMITGFDITMEQLIQIRKKFSGPIYMDVHTLSRGISDNYKREFRVIPQFGNWAKCLDIIQVNQNELFSLSSKKRESEIVEEIFSHGIKILCITMGELGAKVFYPQQDEIISCFISAKKISNPISVGCGDVFGASFFYSYIRNDDAVLSLTKAVLAAEQFVENKLLI